MVSHSPGTEVISAMPTTGSQASSLVHLLLSGPFVTMEALAGSLVITPRTLPSTMSRFPLVRSPTGVVHLAGI